MADNKPIGRKAENTTSGQRIIITNPPDGVDKTAFLDAIDQNLGAFEGTYEDAARALREAGAFKENATSQLFGTSQEVTPDQRWADYQMQSQDAARGEVPEQAPEGETTALGIGGAIAHGFKVPLLNKILAKADLHMLKQINPDEAVNIEKMLEEREISSREAHALALDAMGVESPDTPTERIVETAMEGVSETPLVMGGANVLKAIPGSNLLSKGVRALGQGMSTGNAAKQVVLEGAASGGAQAGAEFAADRNMGPMMSALMTVGGGVIGDMSASGLMSLADAANRIRIANNMDLPEAAQEALKRYEQQGSEMFLSDLEPTQYADPSNVAAMQRSAAKRAQTTGGITDLRQNRQRTRVQATQDIMDQMGYQRGDQYATEIVNDLIGTRQAELDKFTGYRDEVIDFMTDATGKNVGSEADELLSMNDTNQLIKDIRAEIGLKGNSDLDPFLNKLTNWENMIKNKDFGQIHEALQSISTAYGDPNIAHLRTDTEKYTRPIYDALKKEMAENIEVQGGVALLNKWENSQLHLSEMVDELKNTSLKEALNKGKYTPKSINSLLKSMDQNDAELLFSSLSPEGVTRARAAITAEVADAARDLRGNVSPSLFAAELDKRLPQYKAFIDYDDYQVLEGTQRWLELTAGDEGAQFIQQGTSLPGQNLPGGRYAVSRAIFSNPAIGIPLAAGDMLSSGAFARWLERGDARDMMIKLGALPQSPDAVELGTSMARRINEMIRGYMKTEDFRENVEEEQIAGTNKAIEQFKVELPSEQSTSEALNLFGWSE